MPVGALRRVVISNVVAYNADPRYASIIAGLSGNLIEDVTLSNIRIFYQGGGTKEPAALEPPEKDANYPEPSMFGVLPAYGFFIRHANNVTLNDIQLGYLREDLRPPFFLDDVNGVRLSQVKAQRATNVPAFVLKRVSDFGSFNFQGMDNVHFDRVDLKSVP